MDILDQIVEWYDRQTNGDWEHQYGVSIENIDNPGWSVRIDLKETELEGREIDWVAIDRSDEDWVHYRVESNVFQGACGAKNLKELLGVFVSLIA